MELATIPERGESYAVLWSSSPVETRAVCHGKFPCQLPYFLKSLRQRLGIRTLPNGHSLIGSDIEKMVSFGPSILRMIPLLLFKHLQSLVLPDLRFFLSDE
jgi:hypothetical protein